MLSLLGVITSIMSEIILVTGAAGFIGYHLCKEYTSRGYQVVGIDCLTDYYDIQLKKDRLKDLQSSTNKNSFHYFDVDVSDLTALIDVFDRFSVQQVVHLAAQAGVRYSIDNPQSYISSNLVGFANILEICRQHEIKNLIYASSSSVYGVNKKVPFHERDFVDHPISLYAATKKSNELMAHSYSHLYDMTTIGLRFFTVYGPWGRPDMAYFKFTKAIIEDRPIDVFNYGNLERDFTYIDDIIEGIVQLTDKIPNIATPYQIFNIGNNSPVKLDKFIAIIEKTIGKKAKKNLLPMQPGDVPKTFADVSSLEKEVGFKADTDLEYGIRQFVDWYRSYYL